MTPRDEPEQARQFPLFAAGPACRPIDVNEWQPRGENQTAPVGCALGTRYRGLGQHLEVTEAPYRPRDTGATMQRAGLRKPRSSGQRPTRPA